MEKTIEIPEGYEARIEGNKVILEQKENEDEKTRQELLSFIRAEKKYTPETVPGEYWDRWLAYLERQKEQKWSPSEGEMGVLYKLCYISNQVTDEDDTELTRLYQDLKREYFNGRSFENMFLDEKQKEQQPAEWSEEDVKKLAKIRESKSGILKTEMTFYRQGVRDAFNYKGFRPSWKPSEEQMKHLKSISVGWHPDLKGCQVLSSLYKDLEKL